MKSLRIIFIGLALLFSVSSASGADSKPLTEAQATEAIKKIDASCAGIKSLTADFKQVKDIAILQEKMVSTGKMYFADGMLRWEYVSPYTCLFILNKEKVLLQSSQTSSKMDVNSNRLFKSIARIYVAELEPLKKEMRQMFKTVRLHFGKDLKVSEVDLVDNSGVTVITIRNAVYNKTVDAKVFVVD